MAVLLDLMERYPDKFVPGTDYVASFGVHDDFPGYTPIDGSPASPYHVVEGVGDRAGLPSKVGGGAPEHDRGGCHKTEMTHSEQITDTSSLNMFYNDELFSSMVLGTNFFRVSGLESTFKAPPLCRHDPNTPAATQTVGWTPAMAAVGTSSQQPAAVNTLVRADSATLASATPSAGGATPSWITPFVVVAGAAGLAGLMYLAGLKQGAKDKDGLQYNLQTGDAPLLPNA
jgi:hypothetical protein